MYDHSMLATGSVSCKSKLRLSYDCRIICLITGKKRFLDSRKSKSTLTNPLLQALKPSVALTARFIELTMGNVYVLHWCQSLFWRQIFHPWKEKLTSTKIHQSQLHWNTKLLKLNFKIRSLWLLLFIITVFGQVRAELEEMRKKYEELKTAVSDDTSNLGFYLFAC